MATVRPVNAGHILVFVSQTYCGNQIKQARKLSAPTILAHEEALSWEGEIEELLVILEINL